MPDGTFHPEDYAAAVRESDGRITWRTFPTEAEALAADYRSSAAMTVWIYMVPVHSSDPDALSWRECVSKEEAEAEMREHSTEHAAGDAKMAETKSQLTEMSSQLRAQIEIVQRLTTTLSETTQHIFTLLRLVGRTL